MIMAVVAAATVAAAPVLVRGPGLMALMASAAVSGCVRAVVSTSISSRVRAVVSTRIPRHVAVALSSMILGRVAVMVLAAVAVLIIAYGGLNSRKSRVLAQTRIVTVSPFPIFVPALTAQPVVVDEAVMAFGEPLAIAGVFV